MNLQRLRKMRLWSCIFICLGPTGDIQFEGVLIFFISAIAAIKRFLCSDDATTAVEYAVMLALILMAIIGGVTSTGGGASSWWSNIDSEILND